VANGLGGVRAFAQKLRIKKGFKMAKRHKF